MALEKVKVSIEGIKPMLFCSFPIDTLSKAKCKSGTTGDSKDEWKDTVLMIPDTRQLYIQNTQIQACVSYGGKEIKQGRGNIYLKVCGALTVDESKILMDDRFVPNDDNLTSLETQPVYLDRRAVVNPMTKGRNIRYRIAASPGWRCSFTLCWENTIISRDNIILCVEKGGVLSGLGDGRKIGFGRFKVISTEKVKE